VSKVASNGGTVRQDVHVIGPHGRRAIVLDSEGNQVALHSS
jgi:predicted enzyme related to lactoylglutathione lyase